MSNSNMMYDIILLGFGSVGTHLVKLLLKDNGKLPKVRVVALSDSSGGVHHKDGLPLEYIEMERGRQCFEFLRVYG